MRSRARVLVALIALFTFSASQAEQVWASLCAAPGMGTAAAVGHAGTSHHGMPMDHSGGDRSSDHTRPGSCPLQAASSGCSFVGVAPLAAARSEPVIDGADRILSSAEDLPDLLIGASLFRPPQA